MLIMSRNTRPKTRWKICVKNVFSLSHRELTENETSVLDKRLNFVPTPEKLDRLQIKNDL